MKYITIYSFLVIDEIKEGNTVYCLDKKRKSVHIMNDICMDVALTILKDSEEDSNRFEFWKVEAKEESENA